MQIVKGPFAFGLSLGQYLDCDLRTSYLGVLCQEKRTGLVGIEANCPQASAHKTCFDPAWLLLQASLGAECCSPTF